MWTVTDLADLRRKLKLIRQGARQLLAMGLEKEKRLAFYNTTYNTSDSEIDTLKTVSLGEMASLKESEFGRFIRPADSEMSGIILAN